MSRTMPQSPPQDPSAPLRRLRVAAKRWHFMRSLTITLALFSAALALQSPTAPPPRDVTPPPPLPIANGPTQYWKGNLHTHSLWSDGDDFPEMIADWYKQHGYHFLALTDHNVFAEGEKWMPADSNATRIRALK